MKQRKLKKKLISQRIELWKNTIGLRDKHIFIRDDGYEILTKNEMINRSVVRKCYNRFEQAHIDVYS